MQPPGAEYQGEPTDIEISPSHPAGWLHHFAFWTEGNDALLERLTRDGHNFEVVQRYGTDHSVLSTHAIPGTMIQLMHATDAYAGLFEMIRSASTAWDGANSIRSLGGRSSGE